MKKIIIFGTGRVSQLVAYYIKSRSSDRVVAFTVDKAFMKDFEVAGCPVIPFEELTDKLSAQEHQVLVVVTFQGISNHWLLRDKSLAAKQKGYSLYTYIDPLACVDPSVVIGENVVVCPHAIIEPFTTIGNGVIIRTGVYIGHDCRIGDYSFLAPRASLSGFTILKNHVFVGNNATIRDRVVIGEESVVGAGTVILKDAAPRSVLKAAETRTLSVERTDIRI